jgi:hypothetical protein
VVHQFDGFWLVAPNNPTTPAPVCYQGGCVLPGGPPLITKQQIKQAAKAYLCGSSPADNVKNWAAEGTVKGLVFGGAAGAITGTVVGTPVGKLGDGKTGGREAVKNCPRSCADCPVIQFET